MIASPVFLLGSALATFWAALFHLLFGRRLLDLLLYWFVGIVGFLVGQAMADIIGLHWLMLGQIHLVEATLGCWIAMLVAQCLKA